MQKSTAVMQMMSALVRMPEIQATMAELSKEMMKVRNHRHRCDHFTQSRLASWAR